MSASERHPVRDVPGGGPVDDRADPATEPPRPAAAAGRAGRPRYPDPLPYDDHLAYEQEQDRLAERELSGADPTGPEPAPPGRRLPRLTVVLGVLLVGLLFFVAGVQVQKLLAGDGAPPAAAPAPRTPDDGLTGGRVIAVRGRTVYVREADGRTVKLRLRPDSQVAVGGPAGPPALRPGQDVLASSAPGSGGEADARAIVVVPERQRAP